MKHGLVERVIDERPSPLRFGALIDAMLECRQGCFVLADDQRLTKFQHDGPFY